MYKKKVIELMDENRRLQDRIRFLEINKEKYSDLVDKTTSSNLDYISENSKLKEQVLKLTQTNDMLTSAVCRMYSEGSFILYDEHNPRIVCIVKDGKVEDMEKATSVYFHWDKNEFPSLEITRV